MQYVSQSNSLEVGYSLKRKKKSKMNEVSSSQIFVSETKDKDIHERSPTKKSVSFSGDTALAQRLYEVDVVLGDRRESSSMEETKSDPAEEERELWSSPHKSRNSWGSFSSELDSILPTHSGEIQHSFLEGAVREHQRKSSIWNSFLMNSSSPSKSLVLGSPSTQNSSVIRSSFLGNSELNNNPLEDTNDLWRKYSISQAHQQSPMSSLDEQAAVPTIPSLNQAIRMDDSLLRRGGARSTQPIAILEDDEAEEEAEEAESQEPQKTHLSLQMEDDSDNEDQWQQKPSSLPVPLQGTLHQLKYLEDVVETKRRSLNSSGSNFWTSALQFLSGESLRDDEEGDIVDVNTMFRLSRQREEKQQQLSQSFSCRT